MSSTYNVISISNVINIRKGSMKKLEEAVDRIVCNHIKLVELLSTINDHLPSSTKLVFGSNYSLIFDPIDFYDGHALIFTVVYDLRKYNQEEIKAELISKVIYYLTWIT